MNSWCGELEVSIPGLELSLESRGGLVVQYHINGLDPPGEEVLM